MRLRPSFIALLAALTLLPACQGLEDMKGLLVDLQGLQQGLIRELDEPGVNVNATNDMLSVVLVNSKLAALPEPERERLARRIAEFVRAHYKRYATLSAISVGFKTSTGGMGLTVSSTNVPYLFRTADLGAAPATDSVVSRDSVAGAGQPTP